MKVLFIWDSDYPWDIRVSKICNSLVEHGDEVHLVCRNQQRRRVFENYEGILVHRLFCLPQAFGKLNNFFTFPLFFSPIWLARIYSVAKRSGVDVVIVRDLPMAPAGLFVARLLGIPVILDMAECYPELIRLIWKFEPFKLGNILVRNPWIVDFVERCVTRSVDHIWVMIEESKARLQEKGVRSDKISIVCNTPVPERFSGSVASEPEIFRGHRDSLNLLYVGFVNYSRGLDVVIESLPKVLDQGIDVFFAIIGTGTAEKILKDKVTRLGLGDVVMFAGWVDNSQVPEYIAHSDIGLVPHHKCSHWDNTIPNKLFDYMAAGKAVLVSDVVPMQRIVSDVECGRVFQSGNAESLAREIVRLSEPEFRAQLGRRGREAVLARYNWSNEETVMLECLEKITRNREESQ